MLVTKCDFVKKFTDRITATKKISRIDGVEDVLTRIYYTIRYFNSLSEFTVSVGGRPLSEIVIADEWKDFVIPESVRLDPTDLKTSNLLIKENWEEIYKDSTSDKSTLPEAEIQLIKDLKEFSPTTYLNFINDQATIRSYFKSDMNSNTSNLATLRTNKSLADVIPIIAVIDDDNKLRCRSLDEPYIPITLVDEVGCLFRSDYFNTSLENIFADYLAKKVIA